MNTHKIGDSLPITALYTNGNPPIISKIQGNYVFIDSGRENVMLITKSWLNRLFKIEVGSE